MFFHGPHHAEITAAIAFQIASTMGIEGDSLTAIVLAAYFHDIGRGIENHAEIGAIIANDIARDRSVYNVSFPDNRIDKIASMVYNCVKAHDVFSNITPENLEGECVLPASIVRDADLASFALPSDVFELLYQNALVIREMSSYDLKKYYTDTLGMYEDLIASIDQQGSDQQESKGFKYLTDVAKKCLKNMLKKNHGLWEIYGNEFCNYVYKNFNEFVILNSEGLQNFVMEYLKTRHPEILLSVQIHPKS